MSAHLATLVAAALLLAACDLLPSNGPAGELAGEWRLVGGAHHGEPIPIPADAPITMTIDGVEVSGRAACNLYDGDVTLDDERITFSAMSTTEMGCDQPVMDAESAYLAALADVERWARDGERLTLASDAVELAYDHVPPTPNAPLVGTTWRLDGLVDGDAVASTMGNPAMLELRDDGTLTGTTGCRAFDGRYEVDDEAVRVSDLVNDDRACGDLTGQDEHVLAVIGDGFDYAIAGEQLRLTAGRLGLVYLADER